MLESVFALIALLLVALVVLGPIVLSVIAIGRTGHIRELTKRVDALERLVSQQVVSPPARPGAAAEVIALTPEEFETSADAEVEARRAGAQRRPVEFTSRFSGFDWEWFIGRRALGWVAVVLVIFAGGFFLKYAFENHWVGPLGRVAMAAVAGVALVAGGRQARRRGWNIYFQMLTAAGLVLFYLAVYGAFGFYHLLPRGTASAFLLLIITESAAIALLADAPALGLMAIVGGLLTPLLLHSETDQYIALFLYLVALDVGALLMVALRQWVAVGSVALLGTHAMFWSWYFEQYHPEKRAWALGFQLAVYGLFVCQTLFDHAIRRREAGWEDLGRWLLNATFGFTAVYVLLKTDFDVWLGTLAVIWATLYAALALWMLRARPGENRLLLSTLAIAVGLVAAAFPIQANAAWISFGWAAEAAALWWFGVRVRSPLLRSLAVILLAIAVGRLLFVDLENTPQTLYWPVFNDRALPALGIAACWLASLAATRRRMRLLGQTEQTLAGAAEIGGILLLWLVLTVDVYGAFDVRAARDGSDAEHWRRLAQMSVSVVWAVFASVVLAAGFAVHRPRLRWTALGIFGVMVAKVFIVDMEGLNEFYRIVAFLVAAIVIGIAAGVYQRLRPEPAAGRLREVRTDAAR